MIAARRLLRAGLLASAIAAWPGTAAAIAAVRPPQQRCLDVLARSGVQLTVAAGNAALACVRTTMRMARAGVAPGRSTEECLTTTVAARLTLRARRLQRADDTWCGAADQRPVFGYAGAAIVTAVAERAPHDLLTSVLGDDLGAVTERAATDRDAARCQLTVATATVRLHAALWKDAVRATRTARADASEFRDRILEALDPERQPARTAFTQFRSALRDCVDAPAALFALDCPAGDLVDCAAAATLTQLYRGLAVAFALELPCDLTDDGTRNLSCVPPALEEHVLNRLGYGPDAFTLGRLRALGVRGYVEEQLHPETIADDAVTALLQQYPSLEMNFLDLRIHYPNRVVPGAPQSGDVLKELQRAKVLRAIASHRQLEQVLVDFWFNHFNIVATDRRDYDISPYERIAIRPHVLGRFRDLLLAVTRSPGMGDYLDCRRNRAGALNENFARELMELHTIGVESGFSEADVGAVARAFTGWKEDQSAPDGFQFVAAFHDRAPKTVLGTTLPANGGEGDGVAVLDLLASHPSTAKRVARKLIVRFVSETPPPALVDAAAATYLATDGDLRAVLETILLSPEFLDTPAYRRAKVKRPLHLLASIARATGADPAEINLDRVRRRIRELGEDLYGFPTPSGYPDVSPYWTSPGTMLQRFNVAELTGRGVDGILPIFSASDGSAPAIVDALAARYFLGAVSEATHATAVALVDAVGEGDLAARPAAAAAALLAGPEFLVH